MQAHMLSLHTPSTPGVRSKGQLLFIENSHVTYHIKGNGIKSAMQHIFFPYTHPRPLGWGGLKRSNIFF